MRIAIAGLLHETNTFADGLTPYAAFEHKGAFPGLLKDQEILRTLRGVAMCAGGHIAVAEKAGMELAPLIWTRRGFIHRIYSATPFADSGVRFILWMKSRRIIARFGPDAVEADFPQAVSANE